MLSILFFSFINKAYANMVERTSEIGKATHTPEIPSAVFERKKASGTSRINCRARFTLIALTPAPIPMKKPFITIALAEKINPILMILNAT